MTSPSIGDFHCESLANRLRTPLQKTVGWLGGYGFDATMSWFASMGIPALFGFLAIGQEGPLRPCPRALRTTGTPLLPGFAIPPESLPRWQRLGGYRTLPDRFFHALALALETKAELRAVARVTAAEIRQMLDFSSALVSVAHELERFARGIRYLAATRRASVGRRAVSAYRIAQALNIVVSIDQPVPEAAAMKQAVTGRRRRPKRSPSTGTIPLNAS